MITAAGLTPSVVQMDRLTKTQSGRGSLASAIIEATHEAISLRGLA
jgi:hypothetical protein